MEFSRSSKENILIIDDVLLSLKSLSDIIREAGYTIRPVSNVRHAMMAVEALLPDLILMDVTMPQMNGFEYCRILKKDVRTRDIPIIFVSALTSGEDKRRGFLSGGVDYITKPFEKSEVIIRVNMHLRMYRMQRELASSNKKLHMLISRQLMKLEEERRNMVLALARLTEAKDDFTGTHLSNIAENCRRLAMGLSFTRKYEKVITDDFINLIEAASQLHDIGKMTISDRILLKEGHLDPEERVIMENHTLAGVEILKDIYDENTENGFIRMAMDIARHHHEKWDGTGYPMGLSGSSIPLAARIVSIVDVYDALVNERCYKPCFTRAAALDIIKEGAGTSFDPDIVEIFVRLEKQLCPNVPDRVKYKPSGSL